MHQQKLGKYSDVYFLKKKLLYYVSIPTLLATFNESDVSHLSDMLITSL